MQTSIQMEQLLQAILTASPEQRRKAVEVLKGAKTRAREPQREMRLVTIAGTARLLALSRTSIYRLIKSKRLATVDLNGAPRVTMKSINAFVDSTREVDPSAEPCERKAG